LHTVEIGKERKVDTVEDADNDKTESEMEVKMAENKTKKVDRIKKLLQITDEQYVVFKNNITNQSRKLQDMIVKHDTDYTEMNRILRSITNLATKMFDIFDKTFESEVDEPKNK
jgi:hypothetical protein